MQIKHSNQKRQQINTYHDLQLGQSIDEQEWAQEMQIILKRQGHRCGTKEGPEEWGEGDERAGGAVPSMGSEEKVREV
jgi:hypothetical protein